jgi:hypothetical protein
MDLSACCYIYTMFNQGRTGAAYHPDAKNSDAVIPALSTQMLSRSFLLLSVGIQSFKNLCYIYELSIALNLWLEHDVVLV